MCAKVNNVNANTDTNDAASALSSIPCHYKYEHPSGILFFAPSICSSRLLSIDPRVDSFALHTQSRPLIKSAVISADLL